MRILSVQIFLIFLLITSGCTGVHRAAPEQATAEQATAEQATTEQATTEQATTEQATTEQAAVEQAAVEQTTAIQTTAEQTSDVQAMFSRLPVAEVNFLPLDRERLEYEVGFLWFDRLAAGRFELERFDKPGHYRATLEVRTLGMAALFTRNRRERYESHFVRGRDGYFHSRSFITRRYKGKGESLTDRGKALFFDTEKNEVLYQRSENGRLTSEKRLPLPPQHEVFDFLCAYWNLRLGMYGPLVPGTHMEIPSYAFKGGSEIKVEVLTADEQKELDSFPEGGVLCRLYLDEEIFQTGGGKLFVWLNDERQIGSAIAVDVLGLGDVRGSMTSAQHVEAPPLKFDDSEHPIHVEAAPFDE
ncbi:MAG: hypothetical protein C0624_10600 [Desulfuromonas sp.]|nr:MAG: hypothetical protein C0624_10600 [Desulfuromonas sp.]